MSTAPEKPWLILPCSGIGKPLGTITRWAAYDVIEHQKIPGIRTICLARLVDADPEALHILQTHRILTIDGCPKKCATLNVERNFGHVEKTYLMAKFVAKNKDLKIGNDVIDPGEDAVKMAKRIALEIENDVTQGGDA